MLTWLLAQKGNLSYSLVSILLAIAGDQLETLLQKHSFHIILIYLHLLYCNGVSCSSTSMVGVDLSSFIALLLLTHESTPVMLHINYSRSPAPQWKEKFNHIQLSPMSDMGHCNSRNSHTEPL